MFMFEQKPKSMFPDILFIFIDHFIETKLSV